MAGVRTEYHQAKSGKPRSSKNQMPQSALRSGKYDTSNSQLNELKFDLSVIFDIYGYDATLYHVLSINRNASAREIKEAYLNKGRELLLVGRNSSEPSSNVTEKSRKEFQAISLAYEILSKEHLRALYDGRCNVARKNSVQWSNVVQEKVIKDAHPNEHSHRRRSRRAPQVSPQVSSPVSPPVYDDGCRELDDEIDELMYYCNDDGGINFVDFDELQGLVHILNTSINEKKMHLLESYERQSADEAATREGEDLKEREGEEQRQPSPDQSEDDYVSKAHNGGTYNSVCDAAEEAIFPVNGNVSEEIERELDKSTLAIAAAATTVAAVLVKTEVQSADSPNAGHFAWGNFGALAYGDDDNDLIVSGSNQEVSDNPANEKSKCEQENTSKNKSKQTTKLRNVTPSRRKSKSLMDVKVVEETSAETVSDKFAADATGTSAGWFACCGASEAFANDDDEKIEGGNTGGIDDTAESTKDNADDAVVDGGSAEATEKSPHDKIKPSMKLRKAITSRRKLKSRMDTEDQEQPAEAVVDDAAGETTSWLACCGISEAMANDNNGEETTANNMEKKEKSLGEGLEDKSVAGGDLVGAEERSTKHRAKPSAKLRKAMISRMKSKSLLETEDQEPFVLKSEDQETSAEAAAVTNAGWFTCCGTSEALTNDNDSEMPVSSIKKIEVANVELVEENVEDEKAGGENEEKAEKNKTKASMKLRKAIGSRRKTKSLQQHPEVVATTAGASESAGWFFCCGASETFAENDDISEMSFDHMTDDTGATPTVLPEESENANTEKGEEEEQLAMLRCFSCFGASEAEAEVISDKGVDVDSAKVETKTQKRLSNSARKLRNQLTNRKKTIRLRK